MKIEKLDMGRVDAVVALWCANWAETGEPGPTPADRERLHKVIEGYVSHPQVCCFITEQADEVMGFITACLSSHPVMEGLVGTIEELYVRPAFRRRSFGSQLAQAAVSFLRHGGAGVLKTHTCADSKVAQAFWKSLGWEADVATFSLYDPE